MIHAACETRFRVAWSANAALQQSEATQTELSPEPPRACVCVSPKSSCCVYGLSDAHASVAEAFQHFSSFREV